MKLNELKNEIERIKRYKQYLEVIVSNYQNIIIIGNGGSNSVASHISQDYTKQLDKKCISFSDPSRLTCYINDYGRDEAYVEFLKDFADKNTLVILISSSGNSNNVVNAGKYWKNLGPLVTFTGFSYNNELNSLKANHRFWVKSKAYNHVEMVHHIWLVAVVDMIIGTEVYSA